MKLASVVGVALVTGTGIALAQGTSNGEGRAVTVDGSHLEQTSRCEKGPIYIAASESRLSILGSCTVVYVQGSKNWVEVDHAQRIVVTGNRNDVLYSDGTTRVTDKGRANSVSAKYQQ